MNSLQRKPRVPDRSPRGRPFKSVAPLTRFESQVSIVPITGCWMWTSYLDPQGYPKFAIGNRTIRAHRWSYGHYREPIPEGLHIDHLCKHPWCVNPWHMEAVTPRVNCLRSASPPALYARRTHCKHGHELAGENLRVIKLKRGTFYRRCRACRLRIDAARRARARAKARAKVIA